MNRKSNLRNDKFGKKKSITINYHIIWHYKWNKVISIIVRHFTKALFLSYGLKYMYFIYYNYSGSINYTTIKLFLIDYKAFLWFGRYEVFWCNVITPCKVAKLYFYLSDILFFLQNYQKTYLKTLLSDNFLWIWCYIFMSNSITF